MLLFLWGKYPGVELLVMVKVYTFNDKKENLQVFLKLLYLFPMTVISKYHKLGELQQKFILSEFRIPK
jgi:hypothetical protein